MDRSGQITTFNRFTRVSRETITSLKKYENLLIKANKNLNLIGSSTIKQIWIRHFLDSVQVIDFIDKNDKTMIDIGSGAGFPGLVLAIVAKDRKIPLKIKLIEKSPKKVKFLRDLINNLHLDVEVINQNLLEDSKKVGGGRSCDGCGSHNSEPSKCTLKFIREAVSIVNIRGFGRSSSCTQPFKLENLPLSSVTVTVIVAVPWAPATGV